MAPLYRDTVKRISIAAVRAMFKRSVFKTLSWVTLTHAGCTVEVAILTVPSPTTRGGTRRFLSCNRCSAPCNVLGCAVELGGWGCASCLKWRGRNPPRRGSQDGFRSERRNRPATSTAVFKAASNGTEP